MSDESPVFEKIPVRTGDLFTFRVDAFSNFKGIDVVPHYHMMHELMWFRESNGYFTIENESFPIKNNTLVFIPAFMIHDMSIPPQNNHIRYLLQFEKEWLDEHAPGHYDALKYHGVATLSDENAERLEMLFRWSSEFSELKDPLFLSLIRSILLHVFNLLKTHNISAEHFEDIYLGDLMRLVKLIDEKESYEITTEKAAELCHCSKSWFSKKFKLTFGVSFKKFMLLRKLNVAINLLANTNLSISYISGQAGFTDSAYFCMKFKKIMNDTPLEFRKKSRTTTSIGRTK